ncbi:hypothetical protein CHS0354_040856 [Potamilus streckersoni]|uniref:beta-N-acetylhexosaminidase n=1 Tax=Potamilus streckersoni TaxID=2493646 RepID=A0AAE0VXD0_9BIVA|nr:hypothetical protein CHS0354_040856 [Potamilus streckersoni]
MICRRFLAGMALRLKRNKRLITVLVLFGIFLILKYRKSREPNTATTYKLYRTVFGENPLPLATQTMIDEIAENLDIRFDVLDNFISGTNLENSGRGNVLVRITMTNRGQTPIIAADWKIYAYFMRPVEADLMPYPNGIEINNSGLILNHVDGSLYYFRPIAGVFKSIQAKEERSFKFKLGGFCVSRTDLMPNWYITAENVSARVIASTEGESLRYVGYFDTENKWKRRPNDKYHPFSPEERFKKNSAAIVEGGSVLPVLPTPLEMKIVQTESVHITLEEWVILDSSLFTEEVRILSEVFGIRVGMSKPDQRCIELVKGDVIVTGSNGHANNHPEAYILKVDPAQSIITIVASTSQGMFYGVQTLRSLMDHDWPHGRIPRITIKDAPRFEYRGLHIDVARNFHTKEQIMKVMGSMAMYKMNRLHLHLSDDEGWRLEIPGIHELTSIGSKRCHDPAEEKCLLPMLGSGPFDTSSGSGFYTVEDYKDILRFANRLHIEVIPEFDMPGHSRAAIVSIKSRNKHSLMNNQEYSVIEDDDGSVHFSGQGFRSNVINPCLYSTYMFVTKVISEVKELHKDIQPLKVYHFGGDEVATNPWEESISCKRMKSDNPSLLTDYDLMKYFIKKVANIAANVNISVGAWEDALLERKDDNFVPFSRNSFQNRDIYTYIWKRKSEKNSPHRAVLFANNGYKVVLAYGDHFYFDHPYEPDPEERGLYWAERMISTEKTWGFSLKDMKEDSRIPCPRDAGDKNICYNLKSPENIVGLQAELWSETVRTGEQMDYMIFPRLLAVAERAWHKAGWETTMKTTSKAADWSDFAYTLGHKELKRLDKLGIKYRIPLPGARIVDRKLEVNIEFPGLAVDYFDSEKKTWQPVKGQMPVKGPVALITRSPDGNRFSRKVVINV